MCKKSCRDSSNRGSTRSLDRRRGNFWRDALPGCTRWLETLRRWIICWICVMTRWRVRMSRRRLYRINCEFLRKKLKKYGFCQFFCQKIRFFVPSLGLWHLQRVYCPCSVTAPHWEFLILDWEKYGRAWLRNIPSSKLLALSGFCNCALLRILSFSLRWVR